MAFHAIKSGRFVNRGFLSGPICPIYGVGICLVALLLGRIDSLPLLFVASAFISTAVELAVGFLMDKIFDARWWDYSSEKLNLFGYVCPKFSLIWGLLCTVAVRLLGVVDVIVFQTDSVFGYVTVGVLTVLVLIDASASCVRVVRLNRRLELLELFANEVSSALSVGSDFIGNGVYRGTARVYREYERIVAEAAALGVRIIDAFPTLKSRSYNRQLEIIRKRLNDAKERNSRKYKKDSRKNRE